MGAGLSCGSRVDREIGLRQVAGPDRGAASATDTDDDPDVDLARLHVGGNRRLIVARRAFAFLGDGMAAEPDREVVAVRGLAGLADGHDDAAPVRVSPAIAVLTRGESATESPMRRAAASLSAPSIVSVTNFERPSPSLATKIANSFNRSCVAAVKSAKRWVARLIDWSLAALRRGARCKHEARVARGGCRHRPFMQLKLGRRAAAHDLLQRAAETAASVNRKQSIVAMSGAIMPAPLQKPLIETSTLRSALCGSRAWHRCRSS